MKWNRWKEDCWVPAPAYPVPLPVMVAVVGIAECDSTVVVERAVSDVMVLEFVERGEVILTQAGVRARIGPGQLFVIKGGLSHHYVAAPGRWVRRIFILFHGAVSREILSALPDVVTPSSPPVTAGLFKALLMTCKKRQPGFEARASTQGYELLIHLRLQVQQIPTSQGYLPDPVTRALRFLANAITLPVSTLEIATAARVSPSQLHHLFARHLGISPGVWLRRAKMEQAKRLLANQALACKEIGLELGYRDPLYFSAAFKRETGQSPQTWRHRHSAAPTTT